ncbi:MAG: outer membrane beta-barrel family protein [Bergeyella zoohelcum]|nr:outer membrane beta-barrel family protein [Bergeyella zoohelcum]
MKKQIVLLSFLVSVFGYAQEDQKKPISKEKTIEEVTIKKTKKAVEQKADRTIFDFSEQTHLNTGTALEGIKKLPGLMSSDLTGMAYQGKSLAVYMDSRPLNISSTELNAFLEGLPASSIDRIEVVTNPGAEFPATGGGAILNIITSRSAKSYLTATYSGNYSFSNYDKYRNSTNQSILLNSKNKWFGWQLNTGVNYAEEMNRTSIDEIMNLFSDDTRRGYFARTALSFDLGQDRLLLNYNLNHNNNDELPFSTGYIGTHFYQRQDLAGSKRLRQEGVLTYQKRFSDADKKLDFKLAYTKYDTDFVQDNQLYMLNGIPLAQAQYTNASDARTAEFSVNYSQDINLLDTGKIVAGGLYERLDYNTIGNQIKNLDYQRQTLATFAELQTTKGKWDFILGLRGEDYDISGETYNALASRYDALQTFKKYRLFPNASVQYNFTPMINMSLAYNKKINLPSISRLNPNANYTNGTFFTSGNANLQPTIFDNFRLEISAFDYISLGYGLNLADNEVTEMMYREGNMASMKSVNISSLRSHNAWVSFPFPLAIFHKSLKEIMSSNPDKMSFLYFVAAYSVQELPNVANKGLWYLAVNGQIALPKDIKMNLNYSVIPGGSAYYYYGISKPLQNNLDITLSKKFLKNRLNVSVFTNNLLNKNNTTGYSRNQVPSVVLSNKADTRSFGISVNYKIPTKNKLAKENPNLLLESKIEEKGGMIK